MTVQNSWIPFLIVISAVGCGSKSPTSKGAVDSRVPKSASAKHIEGGNDLTFTCIDSFRETALTLRGIWSSNLSSWTVSISEKNKHGDIVSNLNGLTAQPHGNDSWQMDVSDDSGLFARLVQIESDQATMYERSRILSCTFK